MRPVSFSLFAMACHSEPELVARYSCPFDRVAGDPAQVLGFTADDAIAAASVAVTATTDPNEFVTETFAVVLDAQFTADGDAEVIEFEPGGTPGCPTGRALRIPASYDLDGTLGQWHVSRHEEGFSILATAAELGAISTDWSDAPGGIGDPGEAVVDPGLETWARDHARGSADATACDMTFSLGPAPDDVEAGAWEHEASEGALWSDCENTQTRLLTWTAATVTPLR
jgi:hypothetical protein